MADDPYTVLGVEKSASEADIRKAYRKLAKELHPDLNPGDKAAEERFKQVSAAYHLLSDAEQRARFDRGEIDASGAERAQQPRYRHYAEGDGGQRYASSAGFEDFANYSDIFSDLFGERAQARGGRRGSAQGGHGFHARGADARYHLEVDFLDAVNGTKQRITMPDGNALDLTIPPGTRDGSTLRLKGKGGAGLGEGPAGDALIDITVRPHAVFSRDGNDIVVEVPISIDEAVLGGKVEVPTIGGRVSMTVPKGATSGDTLRLKGRGVKAKAGDGDQRVVLKVVMPRRIDPELEAFMQTWREKNSYDPRAAFGRVS